jgi:hypothetical protein
VDRAVALAGGHRPALRVGPRALSQAGGPLTALLGVRVLPGALWFAAAPETSDAHALGAVAFRARNTGRRAWRGDDAPTLTVACGGVVSRVRPEGEVAPGDVGRFVVRCAPHDEVAMELRAELRGPDGVALLDEPLTARLAPRPGVVATSAATAEARVQTAGFDLGEGSGPSGVAWIVLSVFGSAIAALHKRARREG